MSNITLNYAHREYKNDFTADQTASFAKRLAVSSLPFLALYKPFTAPIMLVTSALRVYNSINNLNECSNEDFNYAALETTLAVSALTLMIFSLPIGMLITTGHDLLKETFQLIEHLEKEDYTRAFESIAHIVNGGLYAALILSGYGAVNILIASLSTQIALGLYHAVKEFNKGNNIEGFAHLGMAYIRSCQLQQVLAALQPEAIKPTPKQTPTYEKVPGKAQYGGGDWSHLVKTGNGLTLEQAYEKANSDPNITFFFRANQTFYAGNHLIESGKTYFFSGTPEWGEAGHWADGYVKTYK